MGCDKMTIHKYEKYRIAKRKQKECKEKYGYTPNIFRIIKEKKKYYSIIIPKELKDIIKIE